MSSNFAKGDCKRNAQALAVRNLNEIIYANVLLLIFIQIIWKNKWREIVEMFKNKFFRKTTSISKWQLQNNRYTEKNTF